MSIKEYSYSEFGNRLDAEISLVRWPFSAGHGVLPLYPFAVEECVRCNKYKYLELRSNLLIVAMILEGALFFRFHERTVTLRPGKILIIPPGQDYEFNSSKYGRYRKLVLEIKGYLVESACTALGLNHIQIRALKNPDSMIRKIRFIEENLKKSDPISMPEKAALGYSFMLQLAELEPEQNNETGLFARAQQFLEQPNSPTVAEIAENLKISESTMIKFFKERTGLTPLQFRHHFQISCAKKLLLSKEFSIKEIADRLGFCNQFHFSRVFRRECGCSPTGFLRTHSEK